MLQVRARLLLELWRGGSLPDGLRDGGQVDTEEQRLIRKHYIDTSQLQALQVPAAHRDKPGLYAHAVPTPLQFPVLLERLRRFRTEANRTEPKISVHSALVCPSIGLILVQD